MSEPAASRRPRRGRLPRALGLASSRERLLGVASDLFYVQGVERTGVDELARRAQVSKASIYQEFGSKSGLVRACLARRNEQWREHLRLRMRDAPAEPRARLLRLFDVLDEFVSQPGYHGCAFINAAVEAQSCRGAGFEEAVAHKDEFLGVLRALAAAARTERPDLLAEQLACLVDGALVRAMMMPEQRPALAAKAAAAALLASHNDPPADGTPA